MTGGPLPPSDLRPVSGLREGFVAVDVMELMDLLTTLDERIHILCCHGEGGKIEAWNTCGSDAVLIASRWSKIMAAHMPSPSEETWREYRRGISGPWDDGKTTPWREWNEMEE